MRKDLVITMAPKAHSSFLDFKQFSFGFNSSVLDFNSSFLDFEQFSFGFNSSVSDSSSSVSDSSSSVLDFKQLILAYLFYF